MNTFSVINALICPHSCITKHHCHHYAREKRENFHNNPLKTWRQKVIHSSCPLKDKVETYSVHFIHNGFLLWWWWWRRHAVIVYSAQHRLISRSFLVWWNWNSMFFHAAPFHPTQLHLCLAFLFLYKSSWQ